jgi:hypothetical protein
LDAVSGLAVTNHLTFSRHGGLREPSYMNRSLLVICARTRQIGRPPSVHAAPAAAVYPEATDVRAALGQLADGDIARRLAEAQRRLHERAPAVSAG